MTDHNLIFYSASALVLTGWIAIIAFAMLKGWNGWLAFKRVELEIGGRETIGDRGPAPLSAAARIDMADLKERIRKLEAIASGVDL